MDVVEILSAPLPRCTRHIPVDAYLLSALHGTTRARSATTRKEARATAIKTLQEKISPRIVRAVSPASECDLDHLVSRLQQAFLTSMSIIVVGSARLHHDLWHDAVAPART